VDQSDVTAPALQLADVSCTFADKHNPSQRYTAVRDVNLTVGAGEFVSVVGPTGCGKSTLLNVAAGLLAPSSGTVEVFGTPLAEVSSDQRRSAKAINFGLIYGMSAFGLAKQLGIPRNAAQEYIELYFARYPGVKRYMEETRAQAKAQGYVETVFGRRLYLPDINARNKQFQQAAERAAINAPMQGTAADIIKRAMIAVDAWCSAARGARIIMQVHDELVLEVETERLAEVTDAVRERMMGAASLRVPLKVDAGSGPNWDEAH
jgi:DNA polymerase-1